MTLDQAAAPYPSDRDQPRRAVAAFPAILSAEVHHAVIDAIQDGILIVDPDGLIAYANPAAEHMFCRERGEMLGEVFGYPIVVGESAEIDIVRADKRLHGARMQARSIPWQGCQAHLLILRGQDDTGRPRQEGSKQSDKLLNAIVSNAPLALVCLDNHRHVTLWNHAAETLFGWRGHEVLGRPCPNTGGHAEDSLAAIGALTQRGNALSGRVLIGQTRRDGKQVDLQAWSAAMFDANSLPSGAVLMFSDITERRRLRAHMRLLADRDFLTALPNHRHFRKELRLALDQRRKQRDTAPLMVIQMDLDRFKNINESLGQSAGDKVLQHVARRLAGQLYETDLLARTGADKFSILIQRPDDLHASLRVAEKLLRLLDEPFSHQGELFYLTASIGLSVYPNDGASLNELTKAADVALGRAKKLGGAKVVCFTPEMGLRARNHLSLESKLRKAIAQDELRLHYQPQYCIGCGRMQGVEALVRWQHPVLGMIPPSEFIFIAESGELIHPLSAWVLRQACRQQKTWHDAGLAGIRMAVNISAKQFLNPNFLNEIAAAVADTGIHPGHLEMELTESMLMADERVAQTILAGIKELGIGISLDDFGTGYSALARLSRMPIDVLKIDQSFIRQMDDDPRDGIIVKSIGSLARELGLRVIAEGVETMAQYRFIRQHVHCHEIQGYLFSRPVPAADIPGQLDQGRADEVMPCACRNGAAE